MDALEPQIVFSIFGLEITNVVVSTWVMIAVILTIAAIIKKYNPGVGEVILELVGNIAGTMMSEDINISKYLPLLSTLAVFLVFGNIFGVLPGMVSPTTNVNTTIALSLIVFFAVHIYGIREKGLWGYIKDVVNPIYMFPLEIVGQISRTLSMAIRLFGNVMSTDLIVIIVFSLIPVLVPLPFTLLGILTGVLQAYIFLVLSSLYIASAVEVQEVEEERRTLKKRINEST